MKYHESCQNVTQRCKESKFCWKNDTNRLAWFRVATKLPKNAASEKYNKGTPAQVSFTVIDLLTLFTASSVFNCNVQSVLIEPVVHAWLEVTVLLVIIC